MRHETKTVIAIAALALVLAGACSGDDQTQAAGPTTAPPDTTAAAPDVAAALTAVVRDIVGNDASIPGLLLHVEAPNQGVDVSVAAGLDDRAAATSLAPDAGIRIASNAAEQAGMGIFRHDLAGAACWGHAGFWGTVVLTCPAVDVTVASSILEEIPAPGYNEDEVLVRAFEVGTEG